MVPPMDQNTHKINLEAPLSEYRVWKSYDSAQACEADRAKDRDRNIAKLKANEAKYKALMKEEDALPKGPVTSERRELWHEEETVMNEWDALFSTA